VPSLLAFGEELRDGLLPAIADATGRPRGTSAAARAALEQRYLEALADPDRHLVVVVNDEEEPLGMALLTVATANALLDLPAVHMSHAVVADRHKRRGAGKGAGSPAAAATPRAHGLEQLVGLGPPPAPATRTVLRTARLRARWPYAGWPPGAGRAAPAAQVETRPADHVVAAAPGRARAALAVDSGAPTPRSDLLRLGPWPPRRPTSIARSPHPRSRLLLLDGHSLAYRAFFALPSRTSRPRRPADERRLRLHRDAHQRPARREARPTSR
jgi:hypothetical protein